MRREQAFRKLRETARRDDGGRCKGWSDCSRSKAGGRASVRRRRTDVEEDWGAARAWGVLLWVVLMMLVVKSRACIASGVDGGMCV